MTRRLSLLLVMALALVMGGSAQAHANLIRSEPPGNSVLQTAPAEIRLTFTEPLEASFSSIRLRDVDGDVVDTPPAEIDPDDPYQLVLRPGDLPDGLYTVAWRVLSAADGHITQGSFPLVIGAGFAPEGFFSAPVDERIPAQDAVVRWLNLLSLALVTGGITFLLFVWRQAVPRGEESVERRLRGLLWVGWGFMGLTTLLVLWMQVGIVTDAPLLQAALDFETMAGLMATRFGQISMVRVACWLVLGVALGLARRQQAMYGLALGMAGSVLLTQSLFSHASAAQDANSAVMADWLHLAATGVWIGGLVAFALVIGRARQVFDPAAPVVGRMVAYFSNYARVAVAALVLTGVYAAWLQVGTPDLLLTTAYGQALLVKTVLLLPLLAIALVNLTLTHRRLMAGDAVWVGHLRRLVSAEIALTVAILGAVGVMTSISPARNVGALRQAAGGIPSTTIYESVLVGNAHVDLEISPGLVGENTFAIILYDHLGEPLDDASLIRLRFDHMGENLGTSELRPEPVGGGRYEVTGANLSAAGAWRIRTTVQRPGEFDTVVDFRPSVALAPPPPPAPDSSIPALERGVALLVLGMWCIGIGGLFAGETRLRLRFGSSLLALLLIVCGIFFLVNGLFTLPSAEDSRVSAASEFIPPADSPVRLVTVPRHKLPLLITADGSLLRPEDDDTWAALAAPAPVRDAYVDGRGVVWAATDDGLLAYDGDDWRHIDSTPAARLVSTHGYLYALGEHGAVRLPAGRLDAEGRRLDLPLPQSPATGFVMMGTHTHVLHNGTQVFETIDLGLSWEALDLPAPITLIAADAADDLLAVTDDGLLRWRPADRQWRALLPLPASQPITALKAFGGALYAAAGGTLYVAAGDDWNQVDLPGADEAYVIALAVRYPDHLWALDAAGGRLYQTTDGRVWSVLMISRAG
jgi:copper transport protein